MVKDRTNKFDSVWTERIFLAHMTLSGGSIVGNNDGVFKTRIVRRVPFDDRWHYGLLQSLGGVPWKPNPQVDESEKVVQDAVPPLPSGSPTIPQAPPHVIFKEEAPRKVYVKTDLLKQIGYTFGCPGCRALQPGRTRVGHSDECRKRAADAMKEIVLGCERLTAARMARAVQQSDELFAKRLKARFSSSPIHISR